MYICVRMFVYVCVCMRVCVFCVRACMCVCVFSQSRFLALRPSLRSSIYTRPMLSNLLGLYILSNFLGLYMQKSSTQVVIPRSLLGTCNAPQELHRIKNRARLQK